VHPGFHVLVVYRIGHWRLTAPWWLRLPATAWYKIANNLVIRNLYGTEIGDEAIIGRRVRIGHHQTIHIPSFCVIGDDSSIRHNVTIGFTRDGAPRDAVPKIGRRVAINPGACILGPITIGDDATIGPASIVTVNVPAGATVFAAPARIMQPNTRPRPV
jgi:serine O-acetyltransferase